MGITGHPDAAIGLLASVLPALERAEGAIPQLRGYRVLRRRRTLGGERTDYIEVIERNLREKVVEPGFRFVGVDGRLSLARLCALSGRFEEASEWFARARAILEEQGARPLRAVADYKKRSCTLAGANGDRERALPLLDAALAQFREIGMAGWVRRGDELRDQVVGGPR